MASFLYRIGRAAFRRRWWFITAWAAVLTIVALSAGLFMGTLTNQFSIPGTETQQTLDRLKEELPEAAGGTGTIVFQTKDGEPFTQEQKSAVASALAELEDLDPVREAREPFATQQQLDDALAELEDGRAELDEGRADLEDGREQLADGKQQLQDGRAEIADGWEQLEAGKQELADGRAQLEESRPELEQARNQLAEGRAEYEAGKAQLEEGRAEYQAGKQKLEQGRTEYQSGLDEYRAGVEEIEAGKKQIASAQQDLADGQSEIDAGRTQYDAGVAQLTSQFGVSTLAEVTQALDAQQAQLDAAAESGQMSDEEIAASQAKIDEGRAAVAQLTQTDAQLDAGQAELDQGRATLESKQRELAAGEAELADAKQQLDAAKQEIEQGQSELDAAAAQLAEGQSELDAAAAQLAEGEEQLAAGEREFAAGEEELAAGEAEIAANEERLTEAEEKLEAEAAKIPDAEAEIAEGEAELADAEDQISLGARQAASSEGLRFVSEDGTTAAASIQLVGSTDAMTPEEREEIQRVAGAVEADGIDVDYSKEIVQDLSEVFGAAEIIGIVIAAIVLFVMLGTVVAAGLPLVVAVLGVAVGVGSTMALSSVIEMASITPALALMLGLAVGIDYSLFIVHRHRRQLLEGMEMEESIGRATGTSGNAVVFAGLTVVIALAALVVPGLPFLSILGLSAAFTVAVSVVMALTLTPALLAALGHRLLSRKARARAAAARQSVAGGVAPPHADAGSGTGHERTTAKRGWGALTTRRPWITAIVSVAVLGIVALPALDLRTALPDGGAEPEGSSARTAYDEVAERFGAGYNGPLMAVVDLPRADGGAALEDDAALEANLDVSDYLREMDGVVAAVPVSTNEENTVGVIQIIPETGPSDAATEELVHDLRAEKGAIASATGAEVSVTGQVVGQIDVSEKLAEALPVYLGIVVGLSLILLLLVFRSIVVPLLATAGFLLSLFAAFGATVAVYQWGWLGGVFGVTAPGPIMSFLPILLTGILFGLAMDYQVFLVSGMREAFAHGENARDAVKSGFRHAAPVVTAAALIMASVFAGFIFSHMTMIRAIGFSLAFGVLFDAFVVRMTLTPAVMHLLGRHAWYLPRWLDRILPDVDVEGARLQGRQDAAPAADGALGVDAAFGRDGEFYAETPSSPATSELPATSSRP
ncbi:MMPL family transporter [Zhihengliuella salsuginis]|uniref:SSD domain-containing protein n=1 Tax=Zhihengliuella salsuginis TaxID=578222 RepID=A0ABQ3GLH9_9MICC|nr:MMPL family transporter [Zhihengliuella salsuginis]GHD09946.1 hypothetical protein GCM10008096_23110 [Zhihengliuella salsuginis]